uniref:Post-GPI attachment to proteins factor 2 n=1 Tax=Strongyloides stercoralis TaxID=6248 RepID=A0A0K0DS10_STRER
MKEVSSSFNENNSINCIKKIDNNRIYTDGITKYTEIIRLTPLIVFIAGIVPPLVGSITSISLALLFHNADISNYNWQCGRALLPSLSRIINLPVERVFWQILILMHVPLRFLEISVQTERYARFENIINGKSKLHYLLVKTYTISGLLELVFITFLSVIGERENAQLHVICFYLFGTSGIIFMITNTILHRRTLYYCKPHGISSYYSKIIFLTIYCTIAPIMIMSFYFYFKKCTKYAYEIFAICEYFEVIVNILFHSTAYWDIKEKIVLCTRYVEKYINEPQKIFPFDEKNCHKVNESICRINIS